MSDHSDDESTKYSHQTFVFYPLKHPEVDERKHLVRDKRHESSRYLRQHEHGFVFIRWLQHDIKNTPDTVVGLYASVARPHELVVIKRVIVIHFAKLCEDADDPMTLEIEQCTLSDFDPLVRRELPLYHPDMGRTPFPQLHAFQVHRRGDRESRVDPGRYKDADFSLFYKYYNGGTIRNLFGKYERAGRKVPEGFIWHFIAEVGRALSWLHTGVIPSRDRNLQRQADIGVPGKDVNTSLAMPGWEPICHFDGHANNIWLHYPSAEERKADPRLERFTDSMPQIILGDFGLSFQAKNDRIDFLNAKKMPAMPEPATLKDKAHFARTLFDMLLVHVQPGEYETLVARRGKPENRKKGAFDMFEAFDMAKYMKGNYSDDLVTVWEKVKMLVAVGEGLSLKQELEMTDPNEWARFPSNDFTYGTLIAMADRYLANYAGSADEESVRWTQDNPAQLMPCRAHPQARWPKQHRVDWEVAMSNMETVAEMFGPDYGGDYNRDYDRVRICQAHLRGGLTAHFEKELPLEQPEWGGPPPPKSDDGREYVTQAKRATVGKRRPSRRAPKAPPTEPEPSARPKEEKEKAQMTTTWEDSGWRPDPPKYRERVRIVMEEYKQKCIEAGLWKPEGKK